LFALNNNMRIIAIGIRGFYHIHGMLAVIEGAPPRHLQRKKKTDED